MTDAPARAAGAVSADPTGAGATVGSLGEDALIARVTGRFAPLPDRVEVGPGDDAAVVRPPRGALEAITTDALIAGVHFDFAICSAGDVGHKALAVNLSDLASMGATPRGMTLSLGLPASWPLVELDALAGAMAALAGAHGVALVGGNISESPRDLFVDVTAWGDVKRRGVLTRSGGRPGDLLVVTGRIGQGAAGLAWLRANRQSDDPGPAAQCVAWYRRPEPRVRVGQLLAKTRTARASIDLSDGLARGVEQLATASGCGATIDAERLPMGEAASTVFRSIGRDPLQAAVAGGDDYELLFAVPPRERRQLAALRKIARGVELTEIGRLTKDAGVALVRDGEPQPWPTGFAHFAGGQGRSDT